MSVHTMQGCQLLFTSLLDTSEQVFSAVQRVFLPAFAMWAQELGKLEVDLVQSLLDRLEGLVKVRRPHGLVTQGLGSICNITLEAITLQVVANYSINILSNLLLTCMYKETIWPNKAP